MKRIITLSVLLLLCFCSCATIDVGEGPFPTPEGEVAVVFSVACDMRNYTGCNPGHFRGACEALAAGGPGEFMVSPGDIDPPRGAFLTIRSYIGANYGWYPVVGNHEEETQADMEWLRDFNKDGASLQGIVNAGPAGCEETNYSFEIGDTHFITLNEYCDGQRDRGTDGDIPGPLYDWLVQDLQATSKPVILVFGHEPAYPRPDAESGRLRHNGDSLDAHPANRDRFWGTLVDYGVTAYICGHTHNYSAVKINRGGVIDGGGVWQIDAGHAGGTGDTGARGTFLMLYIMRDLSVWYYTYRLYHVQNSYVLTDLAQIR